MTNTRSFNDDEGFTLIEVLIAIGLFVTIAVSVAQLMATAIETNRAAREHTSAVVFAASKMDQLLAASPASTSSNADYLNEAGTVVGTGANPPGDAVFVRRWTSAPLPADPDRTLVLSVRVTPVRLERLRGGAPWPLRAETEALLVSVRTRSDP